MRFDNNMTVFAKEGEFMKPTALILPLVLIFITVLSACNLPTPGTGVPAAGPSESPAPGESGGPTSTSGNGSGGAQHKVRPGEPGLNDPVYDSEAHSTANLKYASNGDLYDLNRFERPFTQNDMQYLSYIDIKDFYMSKDADWYYATVEIWDMSGVVKGLEPAYGIEIDYDLDGRGDYLIWVTPPFSKDWGNDSLSVYTDPNHSVGGFRPEKADSTDKAGDGYEKAILTNGQGDDPDIAWVRISPSDPNTLEFAFKKSLIPEGILEWSAWADAGLKDPLKFAYNDRMSLSDAGSPLKDNPDYPLKGIYAVDNTCYNPYGSSKGYLPLICPFKETPTPRPKPGPTHAPTATWTQKPPG